MTTEIQDRRDISSNWTAVNPILGLGEEGLEIDTHRVKYGDGSTRWTSLPYFNASDVGADVSGAAAAEATRATGAESALSTAITSEASARATGDTGAVTTAEGFATSSVGTETTRATAAEGGAAQKSANLSDLADPATALGNIGGVGPTLTEWGFLRGVSGIVPDGTTDNYAVIGNAIAGLPTNGGIINFPAGSIATSGTLILPAYAGFNGQGPKKTGDTTGGTEFVPTAGFTPDGTDNALVVLKGNGARITNLSIAPGTQAQSALIQDVFYNHVLEHLILKGGTGTTWVARTGLEQASVNDVLAQIVGNSSPLFWGGWDSTLVNVNTIGAAIIAGTGCTWEHYHCQGYDPSPPTYLCTVSGPNTFVGTEIDGVGTSGAVAHAIGGRTSVFVGGTAYNRTVTANAPIFVDLDTSLTGGFVVEGFRIDNGGMGTNHQFSALYSAAFPNPMNRFVDMILVSGSIQTTGSVPNLWASVLPGRAIGVNYNAIEQPDVHVGDGTAVLVAGTVAVGNAAITASSRIKVFVKTPGGTVGAPFVSVITAGTGFTIKSTSSSDTSTIRYEIESY